MTKQKQIEKLEQELREAYQTIDQLREDADKGFLSSPEYQRIKQDLRFYELSYDMATKHIETEVKSDKRLLDQIKKIRDDNVALCAEHEVEYWEGLTEISRNDDKDIRDLEKKIIDLEAKIAAKDIIIEHLKDLLAGRDPDEPKEIVMGRKPIPEDTKKRIRSYRKTGYTLKEISEMEGISIGAVSGICKGIKKKQ